MKLGPNYQPLEMSKIIKVNAVCIEIELKIPELRSGYTIKRGKYTDY